MIYLGFHTWQKKDTLIRINMKKLKPTIFQVTFGLQIFYFTLILQICRMAYSLPKSQHCFVVRFLVILLKETVKSLRLMRTSFHTLLPPTCIATDSLIAGPRSALGPYSV